MRKVLVGFVVVACSMIGVGPAAADAPAWCPLNKFKDSGIRNQEHYRKVQDSDPRSALEAIAISSCLAPTSTHAKEVNDARAEWSKKLGMVEGDWADVAAIVADRGSIRDDMSSFGGKEAFPDRDKYVALSTLTPFQQLYAIAERLPGNYGGVPFTFEDHLYIADALGPNLSEAGRLAYVLGCMKDPMDWPLELAICNYDVTHFDRAKFADEVRAEKNTANVKMNMRLLLLKYDEVVPKYQEAIKKIKADDPAYPKMFDIAAKTRAAWDQIWKTETKMLELALAMDDARETRSKKAHEGCSEKTWAAFKEAVGKVPASKFVAPSDESSADFGLYVALSSPRAYLASVALASCEKEDQDGLIGRLNSSLGGVPGLRGPRLATWQAIIDTNLQLDQQGAKLNIGHPDQRKRFYSTINSKRTNSGFGTIAKVGKPDADGLVEVTFAKKMEKREACLKSQMTNRISHFLNDGQPVYYHNCLKWGMQTVDKTPDPLKANKRYIDGLKPGMNAGISDQAVFAVYPKGKKTPVVVLGSAVK